MHSLDIKYDALNDVVDIAGVRYSGELFRSFGFAPAGRWLKIISRGDGVLSVQRVSDEIESEFSNIAEYLIDKPRALPPVPPNNQGETR